MGLHRLLPPMMIKAKFLLTFLLVLSSLHHSTVISFLLRPSIIRHSPSLVRDSETTFCRSGTQRKVQCWILPNRLSWHPATILYYGTQQASTMNGDSSVLTDTANGAVVVNGASNGTNGMTSSSNNNGHQLLSMNTNGDDTTTLNLFDENDIPRPTAKGGFSHTKASKAKIAAANKGKTPWNKGQQRTEETKARIAAGVRARNRERFLQKLQDMGVTEVAYEATKKEARREKDAERRSRRTSKGGYSPTEETKAKISRILKAKHAKGDIKPRKVDLSKVRRGFKHSDETKAKISEALKQRWANDSVYRENMQNQVVKSHNDEEVRQRISTTLKKKWQNPEFRSQMMEKISTRNTSVTGVRDTSHREKISKAMKAKWQEAEYREKTLKSIAKRKDEMQRDRPAASPAQPRKPRPKKITQVKGSAAAQRSDGVVMVQPMAQGDTKQPKKKKKAPRKKTVRLMDKDDDDGGPVATVEPKTKGAGKKVAAKKKEAKKKEPDGSVNRLKEERRDLFDLLYGDDDAGDDDGDDDGDDEGEDDPHSLGPARFALGDEDLDSFDPYGLDDY